MRTTSPLTMPKPPRAWTALDTQCSLGLGRAWHDTSVWNLVPVRLRAAGGSAVLRGPWMLRAALRLPPQHALLRGGPAGLAQWFGAIHLRWLLRSGVAGVALYEGPVMEDWSCFASRRPGDLVVGHRKVTGIEQAWQRHGVLLSSGTLLTKPPWRLLCATLRRPMSEAMRLQALAVDVRQLIGAEPEAYRWTHCLGAELEAALAALPPAGS